MINEEILEKAIYKTAAKGWGVSKERGEIIKIEVDRFCLVVFITYEDGYRDTLRAKEIIFSHDFAKAFWGEETNPVLEITTLKNAGIYMQLWKIHLQRMVLEEEPLKYLERFL